MWLKWWLAFFVALSYFLTSIRGHSLHPKLLLISFDGFRYDYLDLAARRNANISGFLKIWDSGFRAQWVENEFTTRTGPSHFSIVTGRHEESHGIIDNVFFDPELNKTFFFSSNLSMRESYWFDVGAEPIWVTNQRQGHKSGVIFWPGSTTPIKGIVPTAAYPVYNSSIPLKTRIDDVVRWLTEENMNLALLYYHEPDSQGHKTGPNSPELLKTIEELNEAIEYLLRKIKENKVLSLSLNIILTSDHGMIEVSRNDVIILENYLDEKMYFSPGPSVRVLWGLWPVGGYTQKNIIEKLSGKHEHLHVYRKEDVPPRLFYSASSRIAPVVVYPDPGWLIAKSTKDILTMGMVIMDMTHSVRRCAPSFWPWGQDSLVYPEIELFLPSR
ncbi:unnamed protein product [Calicophoron daubneyi]|uniref:Ectonucleotide pyrophosphatase/phosphodiesterase family member 5 n=1 Tax=Calicophoron daubneyi TaxID=300641 RepID=A0AAV2T7E0_CALDB